tara:strand:+ start:64 stop:390 length:327 start_codon:yes stop_codon:yes gene_type:complete
MEKLDLRNKFLNKLKKESDINIPEEYTLLRNQNYCEWLEKQLLHEKETMNGLFATDKNPQDIFRIIFVDMIQEIGMDGEKTFAAMDFDYYEEYFKKGIEKIMFKLYPL